MREESCGGILGLFRTTKDKLFDTKVMNSCGNMAFLGDSVLKMMQSDVIAPFQHGPPSN